MLKLCAYNVYVMLDSPMKKATPGWCALIILQGHTSVRGEVPFNASLVDIDRFARDKCSRPNEVNAVILMADVRNRFAPKKVEAPEEES